MEGPDPERRLIWDWHWAFVLVLVQLPVVELVLAMAGVAGEVVSRSGTRSAFLVRFLIRMMRIYTYPWALAWAERHRPWWVISTPQGVRGRNRQSGRLVRRVWARNW